jgi:phosphohistidine phosphatase
MTLRLILIRHAKSDWSEPGQQDIDRPLNARGRRDAAALGRWLASRGDVPDLVLCSSAARTAETLALILPELPQQPQVQHSAELYHADPAVILAQIARATGKVVMVVGHNPGIAALGQSLTHQPPIHPRFADWPTAATAVIDFGFDDWSQIAPGRGALRDFVVPDDLTA